MQVSCAILAVGAELLQGQINNSNAAQLSRWLFSYGIVPSHHLTVDDRIEDIVKALEYLNGLTSMIFVTGGLGPTSDDLTRQGVAEWARKPLNYDEKSWQHIIERFNLIGRTAPEVNKQQCFFPEGAMILTNREGTANGFYLRRDSGTEVWVLPGPPREISAIWQDHIAAKLQELVPSSRRKTMRKWRVIGRGESHLAEKLEPILAAANADLAADEKADLAYRAQIPIVEIKLRYPASLENRFQGCWQAMAKELAPFLYETSDESLPEQLLEKVLGKFHGDVIIADQATSGFVAELLYPVLRQRGDMMARICVITGKYSAVVKPDLQVSGPDETGRYTVRVLDKVVEIPPPYKKQGIAELREREQKTVAAYACLHWYGLLG